MTRNRINIVDMCIIMHWPQTSMLSNNSLSLRIDCSTSFVIASCS